MQGTTCGTHILDFPFLGESDPCTAVQRIMSCLQSRRMSKHTYKKHDLGSHNVCLQSGVRCCAVCINDSMVRHVIETIDITASIQSPTDHKS